MLLDIKAVLENPLVHTDRMDGETVKARKKEPGMGHRRNNVPFIAPVMLVKKREGLIYFRHSSDCWRGFSFLHFEDAWTLSHVPFARTNRKEHITRSMGEGWLGPRVFMASTCRRDRNLKPIIKCLAGAGNCPNWRKQLWVVWWNLSKWKLIYVLRTVLKCGTSALVFLLLWLPKVRDRGARVVCRSRISLESTQRRCALAAKY